MRPVSLQSAALFAIALLATACGGAPGTPQSGGVGAVRDGEAAVGYRVVVLGCVQDGGLPHLGCKQPVCEAARSDRGRARRVAALALVAPDGRWWLIDATPDMPAQIQAMGGLPQGVLLTHAHIGHYTGLMYCGREVASTKELPVQCSPAMADFLRENAPWSQLVSLGQIALRPFASGEPFQLDARLSVTPLQVPHRNEFADTHAFLVSVAGGRSLLYVPDIDRWESWDEHLGQLARQIDFLVLDGTFYSGAELPGRDMSEVPHPTVESTVALLEEAGCLPGQVFFTHMNHTNPLLDPARPERVELAARGFGTTLDTRLIPLE